MSNDATIICSQSSACHIMRPAYPASFLVITANLHVPYGPIHISIWFRSPCMNTDTAGVETICWIIIEQAVVLKHNKSRLRVAHRGIARFLGIDQNVIRSSHGHSTPSMQISCKSVQPFSRNLTNKETKKERNKEINHSKPTARHRRRSSVNFRGHDIFARKICMGN